MEPKLEDGQDRLPKARNRRSSKIGLFSDQMLRKRRRRVVLLLDLDCFYAQCECLRLGLQDCTKDNDISLALMQWNSCLAVTYPARNLYKIKRGDSWQEIDRKSNGKCHMVHVPILTSDASNGNSNNNSSAPIASLQDEYDSIFRLSPEEQIQARQRDLGLRRHAHEGKASIDRYRTASAQIFATVVQHIQEKFGGSIILERASIDEFFLDATAVCYPSGTEHSDPAQVAKAMEGTKLVGERNETLNERSASPTNEDDVEDNDEVTYGDAIMDDSEWKAHRIGSWVAWGIRRAVFDKLGFTLSAGVGPNKTLAKLTASYGKPNGQAVLADVQWLLANTEISKCRNLGGKLGRAIQDLLPPKAPTTVASIAQFISLPQLQEAHGLETARRIYQLSSHGHDDEAVVAKKNDAAMIPKSITAFKSLPFLPNGHTWEQVQPWLEILVQEIVSRVERDAVRNERYPKTCTIQYAAATPPNTPRPRNGGYKSVRTSFPAASMASADKVALLCRTVPQLVQQKEAAPERLRGIGLCAVDFVERSSTGQLSNFWATSAAPSDSHKNGAKAETSTVMAGATDSSITLTSPRKRARSHNPNGDKDEEEDADARMAKKMQAEYDREHRVAVALDERRRKQQPVSSSPHRARELAPSSQTNKGRTDWDSQVADQTANQSDVALAKSLQAAYDREARVMEAMDNHHNSRRGRQSSLAASKGGVRSHKIHGYFQAK